MKVDSVRQVLQYVLVASVGIPGFAYLRLGPSTGKLRGRWLIKQNLGQRWIPKIDRPSDDADLTPLDRLASA